MNESTPSPKAIVGEVKEGNTIAGKKSRLKALMHRASQEEQQSDTGTESSAAAKGEGSNSKKEAPVKKKRTPSKKSSSSKLSTSRQQQLLINALQSENSDLRSKLEASLQENRKLKEMMEHQQEVARARNRTLQGMVQKYGMQHQSRQQQQQRQDEQSRRVTTRMLPNLAKLAYKDSSRPLAMKRGQGSRSRSDSFQARQQLQQQRLAMAMQSTAAARTAAPNQYSRDTTTYASQAESMRQESALEPNASERENIAERLNELEALGMAMQQSTASARAAAPSEMTRDTTTTSHASQAELLRNESVQQNASEQVTIAQRLNELESLGLALQQSTAPSRLAAPSQASNDITTQAELMRHESVQQNVSEQAKIAQRLSELRSLQEELQVLTNKLAKR